MLISRTGIMLHEWLGVQGTLQGGDEESHGSHRRIAGRPGEVREVARQGDKSLAEEEKKLQALIERLEAAMRKRVLLSFDRSRENLFDELADLDLILEVKGKLKD